MCPLRLILIFLSATLAGFFVIRNLKSPPEQPLADDDVPHSDVDNDNSNSPTQQSSVSCFSKVRVAMESGFWTCVDMASGKYLWRHLVPSSKRSL
ncbi:putative Methyltransferase-related protein [Melia azedarach]|uniref:Methyltransferase-related protein n=1 Tax=Melia azedarach TaxID=155640 RepID=A0ACC1Y7E3_MELAZ|nr:putative Methyltransferase-related protein [Melia azedarach]